MHLLPFVKELLVEALANAAVFHVLHAVSLKMLLAVIWKVLAVVSPVVAALASDAAAVLSRELNPHSNP